MPKRVSDGLNLDGDDELSTHDVDDYNDEFSAHDRDSAEGKGSTPPLSPLKVLQTRAVKRAKPMFTTEFIQASIEEHLKALVETETNKVTQLVGRSPMLDNGTRQIKGVPGRRGCQRSQGPTKSTFQEAIGSVQHRSLDLGPMHTQP